MLSENEGISNGIKFVLVIAASAVISYLLGSCNSSIIVVKLLKGEDIRNFGSGNAGLTNTLRCFGKLPAALTLAGDLLKGVVAVFICKALCSAFAVGLGPDCDVHFIGYVAGFFAVIGHIFPVYYGFKGGKGIAATSGLVISLILFPKYCFMFTIFGMVTFGLVTKFSRYVSLGSITGIIGFFIEFVIWGLVGWLPLNNNEFIEASIVVLLFVILGVARHSGNIKRLINGTERKIGEKK